MPSSASASDFLVGDNKIYAVLKSSANDNWQHMLNTLDKFNDENWDHSRKRELIKSTIANMIHYFPFNDIRNAVLKTAVPSRLILSNIQRASWAFIDDKHKIPETKKKDFVSAIINGLVGRRIQCREFVKWDEPIFKVIKINVRTRGELAFIASIFPVARTKQIPHAVWEEILMALVDEQVKLADDEPKIPYKERSVRCQPRTFLVMDKPPQAKRAKLSSPSSPQATTEELPEDPPRLSSVYDPIDWAGLLKSRSPSPDPFANFIDKSRQASPDL